MSLTHDPAEIIAEKVDYCIRRGIFFSLLGIWVVMFGMSFDGLLAIKSGAILVTLLAIVLLLRAYNADRTPWRRTEVFTLLDADLGLPDARAAEILMRLRRERLLWHAHFIAVMALGMWGVTLLLKLMQR